MTRANGIAYAAFFLLLFLGLRSGCQFQPVATVDQSNGAPIGVESVETLPAAQTGSVNGQSGVEPRPNNGVTDVRGTLIFGAFNIQIFGVAKSNDPFVMQRLVDVARRFDLLAIQELRAADQSVIENFVNLVNANGSKYSYVVGPRQGTTISKEQYVYLFDTNKLRLTSKPYVAIDPTGDMHRSPLVASFEYVRANQGTGFTFTALNLHVDPDVVDMELAALEQIMPRVMMTHPDEDDFILMGDFNENANGMRSFNLVRNQMPLIRSHWPTKPRSGRSIDNIVIDSIRTAEYRNQTGVLDLATQYELSLTDALRISDHYPVWAVFSTHEEPSRVAVARGVGMIR